MLQHLHMHHQEVTNALEDDDFPTHGQVTHVMYFSGC